MNEPKQTTLDFLSEEIVRARTKFPSNELLLAALMEEVGELAKALIEKEPNENVITEAIQVACVALRIAEEGDSSMPWFDPLPPDPKMPTTPKEILDLPVKEISNYIGELYGCYYNFIPEIIPINLNDTSYPEIEIKIIKRIEYDCRRFWQLASVWFKEKPVMIIQNAGREGDDHAKRFIVNKLNYYNMIRFLLSSFKEKKLDDLVDIDQDFGTSLISFYGDSL